MYVYVKQNLLLADVVIDHNNIINDETNEKKYKRRARNPNIYITLLIRC